MCKKNYYAFQDDFKKSLNKLIVNRLRSDLKIKLYATQSGLCLICKEQIDENLLLVCSPKLYIHYLVSRSVANRIKLDKKSYESRKNKILLHKNCHMVFHKSKLFQNSLFLCTSIPKNPIFF